MASRNAHNTVLPLMHSHHIELHIQLISVLAALKLWLYKQILIAHKYLVIGREGGANHLWTGAEKAAKTEITDRLKCTNPDPNTSCAAKSCWYFLSFSCTNSAKTEIQCKLANPAAWLKIPRAAENCGVYTTLYCKPLPSMVKSSD